MNKKTGNLIFLGKLDLSICPNTCEFFLIFDFFFFFEKAMKNHEIWICFHKNITHYTQEISG